MSEFGTTGLQRLTYVRTGNGLDYYIVRRSSKRPRGSLPETRIGIGLLERQNKKRPTPGPDNRLRFYAHKLASHIKPLRTVLQESYEPRGVFQKIFSLLFHPLNTTSEEEKKLVVIKL